MLEEGYPEIQASNTIPACVMPCLLQSVTVVLAAVLLSQDAASGGVVRLMLKVGLYLPFMFGLLLAASGATGL